MSEGIDVRLKTIYPYLPRKAKVLELGSYYWEKAIEVEDLDGDSNQEIIALYEYEEMNHLLILKRGRRTWFVAYNKKLPFSEIVYFKIESIINPFSKQILIGGQKEESVGGYHLDILQYNTYGLQSLLDGQDIFFNKIETEQIENKVQIIIWKHKKLEAYDVQMYRYQEGQIQVGGWEEKNYFKSVVAYYKYLVSCNPEEKLYQDYLLEAQRRSGELVEEQIEEQVSTLKEENLEVQVKLNNLQEDEHPGSLRMEEVQEKKQHDNRVENLEIQNRQLNKNKKHTCKPSRCRYRNRCNKCGGR